ncbi:helix-turn-helix domain-containing protein [Schumannella soli]|uniref:helix-turn-helix domain-containing protein n=1 Tax=Schumannella soli TaxID=2590779 RepID=UPI001C643D77|nr:helix-turn-helix domain-containing protein [Schumannella soli]
MRLRQDSEIGQIVRTRRIELGITQSELAERAQVGRHLIVRLEAGGTEIALSKVFAVMGALDLALDLVPARRSAAPAVEVPSFDAPSAEDPLRAIRIALERVASTAPQADPGATARMSEALQLVQRAATRIESERKRASDH